MYTLNSAIAKSLSGGGRWAYVDIGDMAMNLLYSTYERVYAILANPLLDHLVSLDLETLRGQYGGQSITFNQLLAGLGTTALSTSDKIPTLNTRYAKYADAFHAGYKVQPISPTASPDAQLPPADKTWLFLTRPKTDYDLFHKSCLVNVNGFFHYVDADTTGIYVRDGMTSCTKSRQNQLGILSFQNLGTIGCVPITPQMIYKPNPAELMRNRAYVNLGQDVSNKTVMLVLGGYLHVLDPRTFYRVGNSQFCIDIQNLPLLDRYYESVNYLDLSSLQLETTSRNHTQIGVADLLSERALTAYLTLSQSFFVILDNSEIFIDQQHIHTTKMPGMFISYTEPRYPLVTGVGKIADYWYTFEDGQYSITCWDTFRNNRIYWTTNPYQENSITDSRIAYNPVTNATGYFLLVGADLSL